MRRPLIPSILLSVSLSALVAVGCGDDEDTNPTPDPAEGQGADGLSQSERDEVLATVGDETITVGEFANELATKGSYIRTRYNSPERRREFLDQMIRFELLAQEAARRGYDELPEVRRTRKQMMIRRFLEERFEHGGPEAIPEADIRTFFDEHADEFNTPAQVRASHILFRDRSTAERVLRELAAAPADLRLYRRLAEQHNTDSATRDRFGDLRFFSMPADRREGDTAVPDPVAEAAFAIERIGGMASEVVHSDAGYHIIKLTGRRAALHRTFEEAQRSIRSRLHRERREAAIEALLEELRTEADVEENLEVLDELHIELPESDSPTTAVPRNPLRHPGTAP